MTEELRNEALQKLHFTNASVENLRLSYEKDKEDASM